MDRHKAKQPFIIFQTPNIPLIVWFVCMIASRIFSTGSVHTIFATIGFVAIVIWALWEIISGVNIYRRLLGLVVLTVALAGHF